MSLGQLLATIAFLGIISMLAVLELKNHQKISTLIYRKIYPAAFIPTVFGLSSGMSMPFINDLAAIVAGFIITFTVYAIYDLKRNDKLVTFKRSEQLFVPSEWRLSQEPPSNNPA